MKIKCLILDHDDTSVESTPFIHYPAHLEVMRQLRPNHPAVNLEEWFLKNFSPGIMSYMTEELGFTEEEVNEEYRIWRGFTEERIPPFFPGYLDILREYKRRGGIITVVSHSEEDLIRRDYNHADAEDLPGLVFGWNFDAEKRKPHPYPVLEILKHYGLAPRDALIVDDLKPAVEMSRTSAVPIAAAGWGHSIPSIRCYMEQNCQHYLSSVEEFRTLLFS
ncbi:HAD family hydrolase [Oceanispirochaeta sp.]|jgi:phosphoglycolate phosphatase-like HAD superfamily hydrolase|uniref:HAD family hydrolase n=1 Tax=Oceanispirochaeta sp. TaxID=2035350 RepID=UPI00260E793D|nr:HAD hydrolase-like protein [Oceanispirochaeta sp.]MDA3957382.1 HAD hydrolase-like protein [Oceanispirochaeta sp.]